MTAKQVRKEIHLLFKEIDKQTDDEYERVIKKRNALDKFYKESGGYISKNDLLSLHKIYNSDNKSNSAIISAIIFGLLTTMLISKPLDIVNDYISSYDLNDTSDMIINTIVLSLELIVIFIVITFVIIRVTEQWNKDINTFTYNYVNPYHIKILEDLLERDSFTLNNIKQINTNAKASNNVIRCRVKAKIFTSNSDII